MGKITFYLECANTDKLSDTTVKTHRLAEFKDWNCNMNN